MSEVQTRVELTYSRIRADVLAGRLAPGRRLPFAWLVEHYGASTGVLREALPRLVEQGLVVSRPQAGFQVAPVSVEDLRQLTEARVAIESLVLQQSIAAGDISWESRVLAAHHRLARTPMHSADGKGVSERWQEAHADYHGALLEACPNRRLLNIATQLRDAGELYRCWTIGLHTEGDEERDIAGEHRRIMDAALAHDAALAARELAQHIQLTSELLVRMNSRLPSQDADELSPLSTPRTD